ncbi:hypothetical protein TNCV_667141 [Trichonephila clavipes]|nr:hypothetical protein TNCV_667141 [Trichonephila clavipes]
MFCLTRKRCLKTLHTVTTLPWPARSPQFVSNRAYLESFWTASWASHEFERTRGYSIDAQILQAGVMLGRLEMRVSTQISSSSLDCKSKLQDPSPDHLRSLKLIQIIQRKSRTVAYPPTSEKEAGMAIKNPAVYLQVDDHVHPGIALQQFQVKKTRPSSYGVFTITCRVGI